LIVLREIADEPPDLAPELRVRLEQNVAHQNRRRYLAYCGTEAVALVAVDLEPHFFLHELYVMSSKRGQGVGSVVLSHMIRLAKTESHAAIFVRPQPLDTEIDQTRPEQFYIRHGFSPSKVIEGSLERPLQ
jgi:GNAT superfamily N-acetyltransferase